MEKFWRVFTSKKDINVRKDDNNEKYEAHDGGAHYIGNSPDDVFNSIKNTHPEAKAEWINNKELREFLVIGPDNKVVEKIEASDYSEASDIAFEKYGSNVFVTDKIYPTNHPTDDYYI